MAAAPQPKGKARTIARNLLGRPQNEEAPKRRKKRVVIQEVTVAQNATK